MKVAAVIPVRMASTRFPGKPLADILGKTMIEHVYRRAKLSPLLSEVWVATCDRAIAEAVKGFGGQVIMTSDQHVRCTDRVAEAARQIDADYVVNIQGDEPMTHPDMVRLVVEAVVASPDLRCVNLMTRLNRPEDIANPNQVKVVTDQRGFALYMSREVIPTRRFQGDLPGRFKQLGFILFQKDLLLQYVHLSPTELEEAESVDMLRLLEHGYPVKMILSPHETFGVDTPADLIFVQERMKSDPLVGLYSDRSPA